MTPTPHQQQEPSDHLREHVRMIVDMHREPSPVRPTKSHPEDAAVDYLRQIIAQAVAEETRALREELARLKASANLHRDLGITLLDAKYLDPACHGGCQSLVHRHERDTLRTRLEAAEKMRKAAVDALGTARNGLERYRDKHPEDESPADDERHEEIASALRLNSEYEQENGQG